jgi:hypothetical protein
MGYNAIPQLKKQVKNKLLKAHQIFKPMLFPHYERKKLSILNLYNV